MRLRSGQPCARSYHSIGTQEYRLCIPVFKNTGSKRSSSGERPNKSLTRSITSFWSSGYGGTAVATARRRGTAGIDVNIPYRLSQVTAQTLGGGGWVATARNAVGAARRPHEST